MDGDGIAGCLTGTFLFIFKIATWIITGVISWSWIDPSDFGDALVFLLVWGILGYVVDLIVVVVIAAIAHLFE